MCNYIKKIAISLIFSLLVVFTPFFNIASVSSVFCVNNTTHAEQQIVSNISYAVCNAATDTKSRNTNKSKKPKQEASFISKAAGFIIGLGICAFLMGLAATISISIFQNSFDLNSGEGPWVKHGLLTGILYFIGRCIATGLIVNIFTVTANMVGFIRWFDYASYIIILYLFLKDKYRTSFCMSIVGGYILGNIIMEMLFG